MLLYLDTELSGTVQVFDVSYPHPHHHHAQGKGNGKGGCLSLRRVQSMVPYPGQKMPDGATPSEIIVRGDSVYVSIRSDGGFDGKDGKGKSDSVATLGRSRNGGEVKVERLTSAYGTVPRTMVINKAGDLVAIGDQSSSEVVVVRRDVRTGRLGGKVAGIKVGEEGEVGTAQGLSSVIWGLE